jgi:NDP-mannose synthase
MTSGHHAVILVGGQGTRLRPYTLVLPKPLMPLLDMPILEVVIRQLQRAGFGSVTLAVNHLANLIRAFFGDGDRFGIEIHYVEEDSPLGTIGPLRNMPDLPENFLLMNGDILCNVNFAELLEQHRDGGSLFTILAARRQQVEDYGVLDVNGEGCLIGFREKPVTEFLVSSGIYAVNREIVSMIPATGSFGFDNLMNFCLQKNLAVQVRAHSGLWLDIGRPDDYEKAIDLFQSSREVFLPG